MPSPSPKRLFLLGHPVAHSLSPIFQNAAIGAAGIDATYAARDLAPVDLEAAVQELKLQAAAGNVTIPHKERMADLCDVISPVARRTNAVNTFWTVAGALHGDNTDVDGFTQALRSLLQRDPANERVALFGAGGAAAAALAAIESWPASSATVYSRGSDRLRALVDRFATVATAAQTIGAAVADATIVVNATPVGLRNDETPIAAAQLSSGAHVLDMVYKPGETQFVRDARRAGLRAADGREMLLAQGALAFVQWFGTEPDKMVMRKALEGAMIGG